VKQQRKLAVAKIKKTNYFAQDASLLTERLAFFLSAILILITPIIRGGNRQVSLVVLLALSLLLLAVAAAVFTSSYFGKYKHETEKQSFGWRGALKFLLVLSPVWVGLLYLMPLPADVWRSLAGRDFYFSALQAMSITLPSSFALSLSSDATWASALAGVPIVAMFAVPFILQEKALKNLLLVLLFVGIIQVLLSAFQLAMGKESFFYFDLKLTTSAVGSFANRNHLANLLVMCLPICIFMLYGQSKSKRSGISNFSKDSRQRIKQVLLVFISFSFLLILLSTLSRGGLISGFIALSLSICVYLLSLGGKVSRKQRLIYLGAAVAFVGFALLANGLDGIKSRLGERFITDADVRNSISSATFTAAANFWPWGSGLGSYESVFPRFQPAINLGGRDYIEYAHNDYAQILMELGLVGVVLLMAAAVLFIDQVLNLIRTYRVEGRLPQKVLMQCFCGVSLIAFLLHCWVEFNMHIPALAMIAAFLAGVFLRKPTLDKYR
jgi:O-antigen ligase